MADGSPKLAEESRARAYATPLDQFHVADIELFRTDTHWPWFERLRREDPVHYTAESEYGPYWSVTKYEDIVAVDGNHAVFSSDSEIGGITIFDGMEPRERTSFISLDPPDHDAQRKVVTPMFTTASIAAMEPLIRERAAKILDELPVGETFDFVDKVSIELTSQMLATLFDFPFEERRLLPRCSDLLIGFDPNASPEDEMKRQGEMYFTLTKFTELWNQRADTAPGNDLISMLAHNDATRKDNDPMRYIGNLILLIVAGSDTTRHSISGGLLALNRNPDAYARLRANPELLASAVPEIIRWQSPVAHMRRTALADAVVGGKHIRKGEKVIMWYVSGNRDETAIENPDAFIIDRERPRQHVAFGFGIHRCVGSRLAEMQLRVVWEEMLKRFSFIEITGEPTRMKNNFVKGFEAMPARVHL
ncbi:MAG TPA: cytochrome P450 [Caulobacteraceae bacterium]